MPEHEILSIRNLNKAFGGVQALRDINLSVYPNKIQAVIGPNGAGKTTFFNVISGIYKPDSGNVTFLDEDITEMTPPKIQRKGVSRTFQNIRLFHNMTILENILVGGFSQQEYGYKDAILRNKKFHSQEEELISRAENLLEQVGLGDYINHYPDSLSYGLQKKTEIARALISKPKLLMLDEPVAGMNDYESQELLKFIYDIKPDDVAVLLIEHDMNFVMKISDHIHVMNNGQMIADGSPDEISKNQIVIDAYLGEMPTDDVRG